MCSKGRSKVKRSMPRKPRRPWCHFPWPGRHLVRFNGQSSLWPFCSCCSQLSFPEILHTTTIANFLKGTSDHVSPPPRQSGLTHCHLGNDSFVYCSKTPNLNASPVFYFAEAQLIQCQSLSTPLGCVSKFLKQAMLLHTFSYLLHTTIYCTLLKQML